MSLNRRAFMTTLGAGLGAGAVVLAAAPRRAAAGSGPSASKWDRWEAHQAGSTLTVDNAPYAALLKRYVKPTDSAINLVAYGAVTNEDKAALDAYVAMLEAQPISQFAKPEQKAYWINLYNAATLKLILDHYPTESILDIDVGGWFSFGPWDEKLLKIEGEEASLNDVEHRILRPIFPDARIHYGVNCASIGCPNLAIDPYEAATMEAMLDAGARAYVNHPRGARIAGTGPSAKLVVSSIYDWFEVDFVNDDGGIIPHLLRYAEPDHAAAIKAAGKIFGDSYDWSLNDTAQGA